MRSKFSAYMNIFNDWDILPYALRSLAPYIDELVLVDGAYRWMAPFLQGLGKNITHSDQPVYDSLDAAGIPYKIVTGVWENEFEKRKAGYLACTHRYIFRIDADEIYSINENTLSEFLSTGGAVGEMEVPLYVSPGWILTHRHDHLERVGFLFDKMQVNAESHLNYLWLIDKLAPTPEGLPRVFGPALAICPHLTDWRTPSTSVYRAAFYVLNHLRHYGAPFYPDLRSKPLDDFTRLFSRVAPGVFLDSLKGHRIVVGNEELNNRVLQRSPVADDAERTFVPLFDRFLHSQARQNAEFRQTGRHTLGSAHLDLTSELAVNALSDGRELVLKSSSSVRDAKASIRYLIPRDPWEIVRPLTIELGADRVKIDLAPPDGSEHAFLRRFLTFEALATSGDPFIKFEVEQRA